MLTHLFRLNRSTLDSIIPVKNERKLEIFVDMVVVKVEINAENRKCNIGKGIMLLRFLCS